MSRDWSPTIATDALNRREREIQEYMQERAFRRAQQAANPVRIAHLLCWRPAVPARFRSNPAPVREPGT